MNLADPTVRFTIPASVALDPKGLSGAIASIAEKLGCGKCFSGVDCLFQRQKDYIIDEKLKVSAAIQNPDSWRQLPRVDIAMSAKQLTDIGSIKQAAAVAFKNLGCLPCTSGFDVLFRNTIRTLVIDEKFNAQAFGQTI